jgi:hypothetical protein
MISVETVNGIYSAVISESGAVRQIQQHGDYKEEYFPTEIAWRASICTTSIRDIHVLFGRISHGDTYDDEAVIDATNALNELLTVDEDLMRRSHGITKKLWIAVKSATVTWASIPTMANKAHTILDRCEEVLAEVYTKSVQYSLGYIEQNNDSTWMPLATELLTFAQQPCFAHCLDDPVEKMMMRANVRRWMTWSSNDEFLALCTTFLSTAI